MVIELRGPIASPHSALRSGGLDMAAWLARLRRLGARLAPESSGDADASLSFFGFGWQPSEQPLASQGRAPGTVAAPAVAATAAPTPRFSVWARLAGDPDAAALRARWEARWDEF
jgi:hypothetical protein